MFSKIVERSSIIKYLTRNYVCNFFFFFLLVDHSLLLLPKKLNNADSAFDSNLYIYGIKKPIFYVVNVSELRHWLSNPAWTWICQHWPSNKFASIDPWFEQYSLSWMNKTIDLIALRTLTQAVFFRKLEKKDYFLFPKQEQNG